MLLAIGAGLYFFSNNKESSTQQTNNPAISQIDFSRICDCYILAGDGSPTIAIDAKTEQEVEFPFISNSGGSSDFFVPVFSPSGKSIVVFLHAATSLQYFETAESSGRILYTAQGDETLAWVTWSADEQYLIVGLQTPADYQPSEGTWPTTIKTIRISDGNERTLLTREQVLDQDILAIYPIVATAEAKKILLISGNMDTQQSWIWTSNQQLRKIDNQLLWGVYSATVDNMNPKYLTYNDHSLHVFDLMTEVDNVLPLKGWSDSPISQPSPDGKYIVYLANNSRNRGVPTLLNIITGEESILMKGEVGDQTSMYNSFWTPDGQYFAFANGYTPQDGYSVLEVDKTAQTVKNLKMPILGQDERVIRLLEK